MTKHETAKIMAVLQTAYPMFYKGQTQAQIENTVNLWTMMFEDKDYQLVMTAVKGLISTRTETYPPNIGSVNEMIQKLTISELTPFEAWEYVRKALGNGIYGYREEWERLPKEVQLAITPDQIHVWAMDENFNEGVASSNFMKSFAARQKNEREMRMIPESVKRLALETAERLKIEETHRPFLRIESM